MRLKLLIFIFSMIFITNLTTNALRIKNCGRPKVGIGNIVGGERVTIRGAYPWVVALLKDGSFYCSGTLISRRKVLSAAHCYGTKYSSQKIKPNEIKVLVGVYDLDNKFENGRVTAAVQSIYVHPDWNTESENFDADIAVLILAEDVHYSTYIQPICLLDSNSPAASIKEGIVVGYGKSEDETIVHEKTPKRIKIPIHDDRSCFVKFPTLAKLSSHRTFCGGSANGTGVCRGDNASGFVVEYNSIYYLRGITSSSLFIGLSCDVNAYAVYTDVLKFNDWIESIEESLDEEESLEEELTSLVQKTGDTGTCGRPQIGQGNIIGGDRVIPYTFPWIAALLKKRKYFCGGVLVSEQKVVTAAHCILLKNTEEELLPRDLKVKLGMHNLNDTDEIGTQNFAVWRIHLHRNWNPYVAKYDSDIAVVVLAEKAKFGIYVQPICLITQGSSITSIKEGFVVGYGKSEDPRIEHEATPKWIHTPIQTNDDCFFRHPDLLKLSSYSTFCAGTATGTGVCNGDSGGGLYVTDGRAYYLRGIVSSSLINIKKFGCDVDSYSIFTDVVQFNDWILDIKLI